MSAFVIEMVPIDRLVAHPLNYRAHPSEQIQHLQQSLADFSFYRNVVVASDYVILAGHGIVLAAKESGYTEVPVRRLEINSSDPKALKILALDNTVTRLAEDDETELAALLKRIDDEDELLGTGYDDESLDALLGDLDDHLWQENKEVRETGELLARRWFVGFVLEQEAKDALGRILDAEHLPGETKSGTLARVVTKHLINRMPQIIDET